MIYSPGGSWRWLLTSRVLVNISEKPLSLYFVKKSFFRWTSWMFCNYMCPGGGFKAGLGRLAERDPQGEAWLGRHLCRLTGQRPAGR